MIKQNNKILGINDTDANIQRQRVEWRRKAWSIPDLKGGKEKWFPLVKELMELVKDGLADDMDAVPDLSDELSQGLTWRSYARFLNGIGLITNQAGKLRLSKNGIMFCKDPAKICLANIIQDKVRLFGEFVSFLSSTPSTVEEVNDYFVTEYKLNWRNLASTRSRMNWLDVLGLIQEIGERKWEPTEVGLQAIKNWILVTPDALETEDNKLKDVQIEDPPEEIASLLQRLIDSPELLRKRSTYNIWVPSPNRIGNLRTILQYASERVSKEDFLKFVEGEFNLKSSSVESIMPFLKASGLLKEVVRNVYMATPAAKAWLETGSDFDFIRILHANMRFVGEMIVAAKNDIVRNDLYTQAKKYGLNSEKAKWIAGFLVEAGLLEETQYLHLKATPIGLIFASSLPLEDEPDNESESSDSLTDVAENNMGVSDTFKNISERLKMTSTDPMAEGKASGVAFEEEISEIFKFMGFDSLRIGGPGDTDVVIHWHDNEGKLITAIIDGKSKSSGQVSHTDISDVAIETHKEKNNADYVAIVGAGFSGDTIKNHAKKKGFALITVSDLIEIADASQTLGLSLQEIAMAFDASDGFSRLEELISVKQRELDIISTIISKFITEQETLDYLSPRDLYMLLRDTELSPSLDELISAFEVLSGPEIGVLHIVDEDQSQQNIRYQIIDTKKTVNWLRALANAIEKGMDG